MAPSPTAAHLERQLAEQGLLHALAPETRDHVLGAAAAAADDLVRWAQPFSAIRQTRIVPLTLSVAAAAPFASAADVATTARLSLWVFTLDDLFDEGGLPLAELSGRGDRYAGIAHGILTPDGVRDPLEQALGEVRADLARYPLFAALAQVWADALDGTIRGMLREEEWRVIYQTDPGAALPAYDDYVESGLYSIGAPPHMWAAVLTAGDRSASAHLEHLGRMVRSAAIAIRLANDLQSYAKELVEGNVNSLLILGQSAQARGLDADSAHAWALARVRAHIGDCLADLDVFKAAAVTASGQPEAAIHGIARFVTRFYQRFDYHTFTARRES